jgi:hypothetical protein
MMSRVCKTNTWIVDGFSLAFQVVFIFTFLTIFFFVYVVKVEKAEFKDQMNYVVDHILTEDIEGKIVPTSIRKETITGLIAGAISEVEYNEKQSTQSSVNIVNSKNLSIRKDAFKTLGIAVGTVVLVSAVILIIGYCLPVRHHTIDALWVVMWVAITEFVFLNIIARNYISADPNKVKRDIGGAVERWIHKNQHTKD